MNAWSAKSRANLATCHQDLQVLANSVLAIHDCTLVYGHRDEATQNRLYSEKKTKKQWPNSRHNTNPSMAMDLAPYVQGVSMLDMEYSLYFAGLVLGTADALRAQGLMMHRVRWGGNWSTQRDRNWKLNSFYDGLHFELIS
jgi:peptidoglycan L-alanyl-D-glutamate endopeptidase CwlK